MAMHYTPQVYKARNLGNNLRYIMYLVNSYSDTYIKLTGRSLSFILTNFVLYKVV